MSKGSKQSFNKLGMFSFATFYTTEYKKEGMTYEKIFEKWKHSRIDFGDSLSIAKLLSTPITPESLKEIGFKEEFSSGLFIYYLDNDRYISYNNNVKKSCIVYGIYESDEFDLHFTSTEQIQQFIKCFQGEAENE